MAARDSVICVELSMLAIVVLAAIPVPVTSLYLDKAAVEASATTAEPEVMEAVSGPAVSPWKGIRLNVVPSQ